MKEKMTLQKLIEETWLIKGTLTSLHSDVTKAVNKVIEDLDCGELRVAYKENEAWNVNEWIKKAILLFFKFSKNKIFKAPSPAYDKVPLKFADWDKDHFKDSAIRAVPGSIVRKGAYVGSNTVLMPSFINIGAYVDEGTMIDTWVTVGSCAQVGKNCHISGGVGLGGVLEPLQANPVIIEDNCFIGARSEVVEGVIVETGAVIGMGVFIGMSTPIVNRMTGEIYYGRVPAYSVVIAGTMPGKPLPNGQPGPSLACAVIVKQVDQQTRLKTSINELLRP